VSTFGVKSKGLVCLSIIVAGGAFSASAAEPAYILSDRASWMGAEGVALGGALVAHANRADFIYSNPAAPAFQEDYSLGFSYNTVGDQLRAQIIDTKSSKLGGGISFSQRNIEDLSRYDDPALGNFGRLEHSAVVSLMTQISDSVALGISGQHRYVRPQGTTLPATAFWSGDIGVMVKLAPQWTLGLAGLDMIADETGYLHRTLSVGLSGQLSGGLTLLGQVDFLKPPEGSADTGFAKPDAAAALSFAADFAVSPELRLRGSYRTLPSWEQKYVGLGLGYSKDSLTLDYGMKFSTENSKSQYHALSLSVNI
jgi:hypothetical protein